MDYTDGAFIAHDDYQLDIGPCDHCGQTVLSEHEIGAEHRGARYHFACALAQGAA